MKKQKFIKEIKEREKSVHKKEFSKHCNHEPSVLVSKFLGQNIEDLKKVWTKLNNKILN